MMRSNLSGATLFFALFKKLQQKLRCIFYHFILIRTFQIFLYFLDSLKALFSKLAKNLRTSMLVDFTLTHIYLAKEMNHISLKIIVFY